jgi:hypothetical protein
LLPTKLPQALLQKYGPSSCVVIGCSQCVPTHSQNIPNMSLMRSPWDLHCDQKEAPQTVFKVHYVSARALAAFRRGDICLVLVYKATSTLLFESLVSSSEMWMHNVHYYCLSADCQYFSMFSLSKVSKLYFHTQFKSHNIQILNIIKCLISTFSWQAAEIY